jgi:aldose 1-epimerase
MKKSQCKILLGVFILIVQGLVALYAKTPERWTVEKANAWAKQTSWLVGCNFIPSTTVNELEMWQADTFDPKTIDRELGWAQQLGFNCVRVFLHDLPWQQDSQGYLNRMDQFLALADKHHIKVAFVLFDSCWNPNPKSGPQPAPKPFVHNSGWVQCPGSDYMAHPERLDELKPYVQGIVGHFCRDKRIAFWDVFNEPDNLNDGSYNDVAFKHKSALLLLEKIFVWAREMKPSQPLTSGVWHDDWADPTKLSAFEKIQLGESDIITFHNYGRLENVEKSVQSLRGYDRPIICTEYMARPLGSTFNPILGWFKEQNVGAFNWGFVSGKTQTIYPWDSWVKTYTNEPAVWFHDIFRADGTPFDPQEIQYIRGVTGKSSNDKITGEPFGKTLDGAPVEIYTLRNASGMEARILTYGGIVQSLKVPDKNGNFGDVVLGYDTLDGYLTNSPYFGALIGRYGNRIAKGHFTLDGVTYTLATNNGPNSLHGGLKGFDKVIWNARPFFNPDGQSLELTYTSKDGEEGYPGTLKVKAVYTVTKDNALRLVFTATTDKDTVVNLTHHGYFNLAGQGNILDDIVYINANQFTPVDNTLIPTGELRPVAGTTFDFRAPTAIGARINDTNDEQIKFAGGYDDNWVIAKPPGKLGLCARVTEPTTGRVMEVLSTEPGLQFYSGNFLDGTIIGKGGHVYQHRGALVMEPQHYPDSPNHPDFPSTELKPGEIYHNTIIYRFSTE